MIQMVVVMAESFRYASFIILAKENIKDLYISLVSSVITEFVSRNMILKMVWHRYI